MKQLIFVAGLPRSGGSLVNRIFDGHSQIAAYPSEARFTPGDGFWAAYDGVRTLEELLKKSGRLRKFRAVVAGKKGKARHLPFDAAKFERGLQQKVDPPLPCEEAINRVSEVFFNSIADPAFAGSYDRARFISWHASNGHFGAKQLLDFTADSKVVHIIRSPFDTISSMVAYRRSYAINPAMEALLWNDSVARALLGRGQYPGRYYILRYEDLTSAPRESIAKLTDFLDLPLEKALYEPSAAGKAWTGNSSFQKLSGISPKSIGRFAQTLSAQDVDLISQVCADLMAKTCYSAESPYFDPAVDPNLLEPEPDELLTICEQYFHAYDHLRRMPIRQMDRAGSGPKRLYARVANRIYTAMVRKSAYFWR
ncbi:MAG: sulfotransferase [Desulfarculaceae bacterium]|nr:sulfotransferase [Desulfarculaceae bacterium]